MKKRIFLFDNLKFLLIMTVVIGHCIDYMTDNSNMMRSLFIFIYSFHMPLFIYLSGLFHSNRNVKGRCISFIFIGYIMKIFVYLTRITLLHEGNFYLLADGGIPWFMFALAMFTACSYLLRDIDIRKILLLSCILACVSGYDKSIGDYLYLSRFFVFYPFYLLGQMSSKYRILELNQKKPLKLLSFAGILGWGILCISNGESLYILRMLFTGRNSFAANPAFGFYGPLYRILCMLITVSVCICLFNLVPDRQIPFITNAGQRTLQIYFWHRPIIYLMEYLKADQALKASAQGKLLWILFGIILTIILSLKPFGFPVVNIHRAFSATCPKE